MYEPIYIGCDHRLSYTRARSDGSYLNTGTCTYVLTAEAGGASIASGTLSYVTGSNGDYVATVDGGDLDGLTEDATYKAVITFTTVAGHDDVRTVYYTARRRGIV